MPINSTYEDLDIPNIDIFSFVFDSKDRPFPDNHVCLIDPDTHRNYTYSQARLAAVTFGQGLLSQWKWRRGDVLAVYSANSIDYAPIIWGCHYAGGVVSPANPGYTARELAFQLKDAGAKALVTQRGECLQRAREACKMAGISEDRIILIGEKEPVGRNGTQRWPHFEDLKNTSHSAKYGKTRVDPKKDVAFLCYSSGTTGLPKGVMLSHRNIVANTMQNAHAEGYHLKWNNNDKAIAFLPFFHIYGLVCLLHVHFFQGIPLVVMPSFTLARFLSNIQKYRITIAFIVPPVVLALAKSPIVEQYDLSSLRMCSSGAAPLSASLIRDLYTRRQIPVKQGYGLTEVSPTTHITRWEDWDEFAGTCGCLVPNVTAKIVDSDGTEVANGQAGELLIKGPNVFLGYHHNAEMTTKAFTPDGWFRTGDIGHLGAKGNFFITDRAKELIKYKGFPVAPAELEGLLVTMQDTVQDVAVTGVWDKERGSEVPRAWVVVREGVARNDETARRIVQWCEARVSNHKRLRGGVRFLDVVPKSASGKILRRVLRDKESNVGGTGKPKL